MAISDWVPIIVVFEIENVFTGPIHELDALASTIERADKLARDSEAGSIPSNERIRVAHDGNSLTGSQRGNCSASEIELDAFGETDVGKIQRRGASVNELDEFEILSDKRSGRRRRWVVHNFAHAQELLSQAWCTRVIQGMNRAAKLILDGNSFAARGQLPAIWPNDKVTLVAARRCGARA